MCLAALLVVSSVLCRVGGYGMEIGSCLLLSVSVLVVVGGWWWFLVLWKGVEGGFSELRMSVTVPTYNRSKMFEVLIHTG